MENWVLIAFVAPFLWALVVLLDIYFVHRVYKKPHEGTIISGLFQGLVLLLIPFIGFTWPGNAAAFLFVAGGVMFIMYFHSYFGAMALIGDGALIETLLNFAVILVPVLAWVFIGERLDFISYLGIILVFIGGVAFISNDVIQKKISSVFVVVFLGILFYAFSTIFLKMGHNIADSKEFWPEFVLFSFGIALGGILVLLFQDERKNLFKRIYNLSKKYLIFFVLAESLSVIGTWALQKAITITPAVSFVTAIASLTPLFVMLFSFVVAFFYSKHSIKDAYVKQFDGFGLKTLAAILIAVGIYFVAYNG